MTASGLTPPDAAQPADARLLRRVRWRLVAWSAGSTLVLLLLLGLALYLSVDASLAAAGERQLTVQCNTLRGYLAHLPPGGLSGTGTSDGSHTRNHDSYPAGDDSPCGTGPFRCTCSSLRTTPGSAVSSSGC